MSVRYPNMVVTRLMQERDEREDLARNLFELLCEFSETPSDWSRDLLQKYPWLKRPNPQGSGGGDEPPDIRA